MTTPVLPKFVVHALTEERAERLLTASRTFEELVGQAPSEMTSAVLVPFVGADRSEIDRRLDALRIASVDDPDDWVFAKGSAGKWAIATNLVGGVALSDRLVHLSLFDLHPRMLAWYLTALWRADELQAELVDGIAAWRVVAAAAMARSLLEGSLAFVAESNEMAKTWAAMKANGPPEIREARLFSQRLGALLTQAQYGTRIGEQGVRRPQMMKLIERGARIASLELEPLKEQYNWLCDAVHPSFGFQTVYTSRSAPSHERRTGGDSRRTGTCRGSFPRRHRADSWDRCGRRCQRGARRIGSSSTFVPDDHRRLWVDDRCLLRVPSRVLASL